jgi:hypothetical protein
MNRLQAWLLESQGSRFLQEESVCDVLLPCYGYVSNVRDYANMLDRYAPPANIEAYFDALNQYGTVLAFALPSEEASTRDWSQLSLNLISSSGTPFRFHSAAQPPVKAEEEDTSSKNPSLPELSRNYGHVRWIHRGASSTIEDTVEVHGFLGTLYNLADRNDTQRALDLILNFFDRAMVNRSLLKCDSALRAVDACRLNGAMMISVLCITEGLGEMCPARDFFYAKALEVLTKQRGRERAERQLSKYK